MWKLILVLGLLLFVLYKNWKMLLYKIMIMYYNIKKMYNKILNKNKVVKLLNKIKIDLFIIYEYRLSDVDNRTYDINIIYFNDDIFTEKNIKINEILYKKVNEIFSI